MGSMITVSWQVFHGQYDISWKLGYRKVAEDAIEWFVGKYDFDDGCNFTVNLKTYESMDCYGETQQFMKNKYEINLATDQGLRDFLATLMHELVHVLGDPLGVDDLGEVADHARVLVGVAA